MTSVIKYEQSFDDKEINFKNNLLELDEFIKFSDINSELIKNIIEQIGSFETFKESYSYFLKDCFIAIDGFIYYTENEKFFIKNQNLIKNLIIQNSNKYEYESVLSSLKNLFITYKINPTEETIWKLLLNNKTEYNNNESKIIDAFVKYTLEIICHSYQNFIDNKD
jgi:DNA-directed RNA polymerase